MNGQNDAPRLDTLHFNSTKSCNLGCTFCYDKAIRGATPLIDRRFIAELANDAVELGCRRVILSGGEPMVRRDWREVARIFWDLGVEISYATNGTLIDEEAADFLASLKPRITLSISLDGDAEIHDELRVSKGAHARTMAGLHRLRDRAIEFDINATLSRLNLSEVPFWTRLARDMNCDVRLSLLHPNGRGESMSDLVLSPDEILHIREYCHIIRRTGIPIFLNLPPLLQYIDEIIPGRGAACGWAVNFCGVLANGDVTICGVASDEPELVAGNITQSRFRTIWTESKLFRHTRSLKTQDIGGICRRCPFNQTCGGACRLSAWREESDFLAPYELCQRFYDSGLIPEQALDPVTDDDVPHVPDTWHQSDLKYSLPVINGIH